MKQPADKMISLQSNKSMKSHINEKVNDKLLKKKLDEVVNRQNVM